MQKYIETFGKFENLTMSYNNRYWHDHADDPDKNRKKDELLDEEAENMTLHIDFDVLISYYEDKVKVTLSNPEFDGELTFETPTGTKARRILDDLEQYDGEDKEETKPEPPKAVPPPSFVTQKIEPKPQPAQSQPQPQAKQQEVQITPQVAQPVDRMTGNPILDIMTDIAEIFKLGAQLKPKIENLKK